MYEHVKTGCKHIPPSEKPLQFQSGYYLNKPRIFILLYINYTHYKLQIMRHRQTVRSKAY